MSGVGRTWLPVRCKIEEVEVTALQSCGPLIHTRHHDPDLSRPCRQQEAQRDSLLLLYSSILLTPKSLSEPEYRPNKWILTGSTSARQPTASPGDHHNVKLVQRSLFGCLSHCDDLDVTLSLTVSAGKPNSRAPRAHFSAAERNEPPSTRASARVRVCVTSQLPNCRLNWLFFSLHKWRVCVCARGEVSPMGCTKAPGPCSAVIREAFPHESRFNAAAANCTALQRPPLSSHVRERGDLEPTGHMLLCLHYESVNVGKHQRRKDNQVAAGGKANLEVGSDAHGRRD